MMGANTGVQIKVWLPEEIYSVVRELAAATTEGNVSEVVRGLIADGLQKDAHQQAAQESVKSVTSALDHLERLVFFIAQNTAAERVAAEKGGALKAKSSFPNDPEKAHEILMAGRGEIKMMANERVRKALHGPKPKLEEVD